MFPSISFFYHHHHHWLILSMWFWSSWVTVVADSIVKWFQPHNDYNEFGQGFLRMFGSCRRCWGRVGVTATRRPLWFCSGLVRLVSIHIWCINKYAWIVTRRPWCQQGSGQSAPGAKCGPSDLLKRSSECHVLSEEPLGTPHRAKSFFLTSFKPL